MRPARACSEGDSTEGVQTLNGIRNADSEIKDETESLRWGLYTRGGTGCKATSSGTPRAKKQVAEKQQRRRTGVLPLRVAHSSATLHS